MNIKLKPPIFFLATALMQSSLQGQEAATPVPVANLKDEDSYDTIYRSYVEVQIDKTTTYETKSALKMRFLVIAHNYIKTHTRPEGVVWMNMSPPDGSMSGIAPEAIKDPEMRAKYIKMLEENNARGEGQARYDSLLLLRKEILENCVVFINLKPGNAKIIAKALAKYSKDAEQPTELKKLIDTMAAEKKSQPPQRPTSSGEAPSPNHRRHRNREGDARGVRGGGFYPPHPSHCQAWRLQTAATGRPTSALSCQSPPAGR